MEDLDGQLLIARIEVSCWKDQLKQAVSSLQLNNIFSIEFNQILFKVKCIISTIMFLTIFFFQGFTETTLMPLQASTILLKVERRRAALNLPLPAISHEQVRHGELATLLTEEDYNLSTMVNVLSFHFHYFAFKLPLYYLQFFFFFFNSLFFSVPFFCLIFTYGLVLHFYMDFYTPSYIFCAKYFSPFPHLSLSSMVIIPHYELFYAITFSIMGN